jgi:hypothetical protein
MLMRLVISRLAMNPSRSFEPFYSGPGAEKTLHKLLRTHFQGEDCDWLAGIDGHMLGDIHGERGFAHRRTRGYDKHLALVHTAASCRSSSWKPVGRPVIPPPERESFSILSIASLTICFIVGMVDWKRCSPISSTRASTSSRRILTSPCSSWARATYSVQVVMTRRSRYFENDLAVVVGVRGGGNKGEVGHRDRAADLIEHAPVFENRCQSDEIDGFSSVPHLHQNSKTSLMRGQVEMPRIHLRHCVIKRRGGVQDRAEKTFSASRLCGSGRRTSGK